MEKAIGLIAILCTLLTFCVNNTIAPEEKSGETSPIIITQNEKVEKLDFDLSNEFNILKLMPKDKNYMVSPFSIKMAMSLAANGAEGKTKEEILKSFGVENLDLHNEECKNLIERFNDTKNVKLNVANSIWLNTDVAGKNIKFKEDYKNKISTYYQGTAEEANKKNISPKINKWVEDKTNGKIKNLLDTSKDAEYLAVLVNTIYFKGAWADEFNKNATKKDTFTSRNDTKSQLDFMHKTDRYMYYEDENMKMVKLPYAEGRLSMGFVLANDDTNVDIENALSNMQSYKVKLSIPKFKIEYSNSMKLLMQKIGIERAFDKTNAEFKNEMFIGVREEENVYIDDVLHKTFIEIDEKGTEAAAATAVIMNKATAMPPREEEIKEFNANKPFIFFIRDDITNEILFIGEYAYAK